MSLLTEISRMKSMMGLSESTLEKSLQKIIDRELESLRNSTEDMGLDALDELDEINSVDEIKLLNFLKDSTSVLHVDLYKNSNRKDFDNVIASIQYKIEKYIGDIEIIVDNIIDNRTFGPGIDW